MLQRDCDCTIPIIRDMSCQHLIENDPHRVDVTLNRSFRSTRLLRGQIMNRPQHRVGLSEASLCEGHCNPKVRDFGMFRQVSRGHSEVSSHGG